MSTYIIELSRNNTPYYEIDDTSNNKTAKHLYASWAAWYGSSYQRIDTAFSLRLVLEATNEVLESNQYPITTIAEIERLNEALANQ